MEAYVNAEKKTVIIHAPAFLKTVLFSFSRAMEVYGSKEALQRELAARKNLEYMLKRGNMLFILRMGCIFKNSQT